MLNEIFMASCQQLNNGNADKHGKLPVLLNVISGTCPNRNVISGTIAERLNVELNKTYLFQVIETKESEEFGRQFQFSVLSELSGLDIVKTKKELGNAIIVEISRVEAHEEQLTSKNSDFIATK